MKEQLVNIFVYGDETHVQAIGWRVYEKAGPYKELVEFLQSRVQPDHRVARREDLKKPILRREFEAMNRLYPFASELVGTGVVDENSIYCVTHIVSGEVRLDETLNVSGGGAVPDYLRIYSTEEGFDFSRLIQDDYFEAIHLLWNNRKYLSCLKLVFSAIDTLGYVEYGPGGGNCFAKWLDNYCDLGKIGVTSDELWELRNSLIHMTNLDSRKVRSGMTHRLLPRIIHPDRDVAPFVDGMKVLHVARFVIIVLSEGIENWLRSYNQDPTKFGEFVERYDTIVSEARFRRIQD
ncbi:MAG: hypothetical protein OXH92_02195 [Bryobacterales bacterium]|nr:hypothetical protein [Bryobacterales bacterium]MDE0432797.1 hypothetical protein [Bryobacterales bacterium]